MRESLRSPILYEQLVEGAAEFICTFDGGGQITFANRSSATVLGWDPDDLIGRNLAEFVHPDDLERALTGVRTSAEFGTPGGTTTFRVRRGDGGWVEIDLTASDIEVDGVGGQMAVFCRPADYQRATDTVLQLLLNGGATTAETLAPVLDAFAWKENGTMIAFSWYEVGEGHRFVTTGLPLELTGAEDHPGGPWARCRATRAGVHEAVPIELDAHRARLASELERGNLWIEAVEDPASDVPALITVWSRNSGRPAEGHAYGMSVAQRFVELILRWRHQIGLLEYAAHRDPLTGLGNRKLFFDALEDERRGGSVLYCDLDHFKPVNDAFGHLAGDALLRQVSGRLQSCVRAEDLVARLGGDEFAILCRGSGPDQADQLAARIAAAMAEPFVVMGEQVTIGISIGVAHALEDLGEHTLDEADRALYEHKARRVR